MRKIFFSFVFLKKKNTAFLGVIFFRMTQFTLVFKIKRMKINFFNKLHGHKLYTKSKIKYLHGKINEIHFVKWDPEKKNRGSKPLYDMIAVV